MSSRLNLAILGLVAVLLIAWLGFAVYAENGGGEGEMAEEEHAEHTALLAKPKEASNAQARLSVTIDPQEGIEVGNASKFGMRVTDPTGGRITNVLFNFTLWNTEDDKPVFNARGVGPDGTLSWEFAPHDGIPYEVRVTAAPTAQSSAQFAPLSVAPGVIFEPLAPPLRVKLLNTFYLVAVVGLGVATGLWLARRRAAAAATEPARRGPVVRPGVA